MADQATTDLSGKTVLITGANAGIGKAAALALARMGAQVVLSARDAAKGEAAVAQIRAETGNARVELLTAELASLAGVRGLAESFLARFGRLDVLLNNAGVFLDRRSQTVDGFETTFAVNHLAPFLLTHLLRPALEASAPARIVTVSSGAHRRGALDFEDLNSRRRYAGFKVYAASKLANILFTRALARRLDAAQVSVTANSCHPGVVATGFGMDGDTHGFLRFGMTLARPFFLTPQQGARTSVYLATSPEVEGVTGGYYVKSKAATPASAARDDATAERLWQVSAEMTGVA